MNDQKYIEDLNDIKEMMSNSTRYISLSGLSGIFAGIFALIGVYMAYKVVYHDQNYFNYRHAVITIDDLVILLAIACATVGLALGFGMYFTSREAKLHNQKIWDHQVRKFLISLFIPLLTGGFLCLIFLSKGYIGILAPLTLIFYGLALVNASKYTLDNIRYLGIIQIVLGLIAAQFIGYGLFFWALGFGIFHILYGGFMQFKYKS